MAPRPGPCSPWISGAEISSLPSVVAAAGKAVADSRLVVEAVELICAEAAVAASEILYECSGRIFAGSCGPFTIRPVARPTDADTRSWPGGMSPNGWFSVWGGASSYGATVPGVRAMYLSTAPPTIRLPYPVSEVTLVKIDGVVIPADEYELQAAGRELVRIRPTASFDPTERWGWPTSQILDLPDTQPGTFSVTFTFGTVPPASGRLAARKLGEYLALPQLGDTKSYPQRTVQVQRQGVTTQVANVIDVLSKGSLGIWEVDAFLLAVNPKKLQCQASAWSPDVGRPRRQARPTLS